MKTVFKQVIEPNSYSGEPYPIKFEAPRGSRPISVALQHGKCCVWFECHPERPKEEITIYSVGTGFGAVPDGCRFLGTIVDGSYVWHLYAKD